MMKKILLGTFILLLSALMISSISGGNYAALGKEGLHKEEPQKISELHFEAVASPLERIDSIVYKNTQYGFSFSLPVSWKDYRIVTEKWEGFSLEAPDSNKIVQTGAIINIRHPKWTSQKPRQDIPIMIFTLSQWKAMQREEFHIGAAPMGPRELGRNSRYVFALPARYNYAFPIGYEEVDKILESNPLQNLQD